MKKIVYSLIASGILFTTFVYAQEVVEEPIEQNNQIQETIIETQDTQIQSTEIFEVTTNIAVQSDEIDVEIPEIVVSTTTDQEISTSTPTHQTDINTENQVSIFVRNGDKIIIDSKVDVLEEETIEIVDMDGGVHQIISDSVLGALVKLDRETESFEITKLQYYDFYGSFYIKCLTVNSVEICDNWQYVVNNFSPWEGIERAKVSSGDSIGLYFGNPYQLVFSTSTYSIGVPFIVSAQKYNYKTNMWDDRTGVSVGLTVPNPNDVWNPIELINTPVDSSGNATFTIATSGEYSLGVKDDYYYPLYTITVASTSATTSTDTNISSGGGSSKTNTFDISTAISFIKSLQSADGSYGASELYSDWVAIAFGSAGEQDQKLESYLKSKSRIKSMITDNERRVMAILSLGQNPYSFKDVNYISTIIDSFDGVQIGEKNLVNDDIFGILVLGKSGYTSADNEIKKTIEFLISKQNSNGSWENSVDLTAAAIQALNPFSSVSGVSNSIQKAKNYIKSNQQSDGGWGNVYSTSWASMAMTELNENWTKGSNTTQTYFAKLQQNDGGVLDISESSQNRIWATSYVIPAALGKTWNDILNSVSKEVSDEENISGGNGGNEVSTSTASIATTTDFIEIEQDFIQKIATTTNATSSLLSVDVFVKDKEVIEQDQDQINKGSDSTSTVEQVENSQLASIQDVSFDKKWIIYVTGIVLILGGIGYIVVRKKLI